MIISKANFTTPMMKMNLIRLTLTALTITSAMMAQGHLTSAKAKPAQCYTSDEGHYSCNFKSLEGNGSFSITAPNKPTIYLYIDTPGVASASADFGTGRAVPLPGTYYRQQDDGACWHTNATNNKICAW